MKPLNDIVVNKFDTGHNDLIINLPYVLEDKETKERWIVVLSAIDDEHLTFSKWMKTVNSSNHSFSITPDRMMEKYNLYKADSKDGMWLMFKNDPLAISASADIPEEKMKEIRYALNLNGEVTIQEPNNYVIKDFINTIQNTNNDIKDIINRKIDIDEPMTLLRPEGSTTFSNTWWCRVIDYANGKDHEICATDIDQIFDRSAPHTTEIKQFLYRVTRTKDSHTDCVGYEILLPSSESDKKCCMDNGWKIHPMFFNKRTGCYMRSVVINTKKHKYVDTDACDEMSLTIEIVSGLQLLYLVEVGTKKEEEGPSNRYHGIEYNNGAILVSNAYTDEKNSLFINNEYTGVTVSSDSGYISRFMYWNEHYDWLLLPKETTSDPTLCDSWFIGPKLNMRNSIKWGDEYEFKSGIFRLIMNDSRAITGEENVMTWHYGE